MTSIPHEVMVKLMEAGMPVKAGQSLEQLELTIIKTTMLHLIELVEDMVHRPEKYSELPGRRERVLALCARMRRQLDKVGKSDGTDSHASS